MTLVAENLKAITDRIGETAREACRDPSSIALLAASKTQDVSVIRQACAAGHIHFGENYVQEAIAKIDVMPELDWHFIGPIQSNKTRLIASHFNWVHSVASVKVARRLSEQRPPELAPLKMLIQVNLNDESTKSGVSMDAALDLVEQTCHLPNLDVCGLMTIPRATSDVLAQRVVFAQLRELKDEIRAKVGLASFTQLSMGMSGDYRAAIFEGSTWIRIGTGLFGSRLSLPPGSMMPSTDAEKTSQRKSVQLSQQQSHHE